MDMDFRDSNYIVLEASAFLYPFNDRLLTRLAELPEKRLRAAPTIQSELRQLTALAKYISDGERVALEQNIEAFRSRGIKPYIEYHNDYPTLADGMPHYDTWSLIGRLTNQGGVLVITGNALLTQRIALDELDVYVMLFSNADPNGRVWSPTDLKPYAADNQLYDHDPKPLDPPITEISNSVTLFSGTRKYTFQKIQPSGVIEQGREANLFEDPTYPELIGKVYKDASIFTDHLQNNLRDMGKFYEEGRFPWAMLPREFLYRESDPARQKIIAGYLMGDLREKCWNFNQVPQFMCQNQLNDDVCNADYKQTLRYILAALRRVHYLEYSGILVTDYSTQNFCYDKTDDSSVFLLDTCSFSYGKYFVDLSAFNLTSPYLYDFTKRKQDCILYHLDTAHLFSICLMVCGCNINYDTSTRKIPFLNEQQQVSNRYAKLVDPCTRALMQDLYENPNASPADLHFSIEILMQQLETALRSLPDEGCTYADLLMVYPDSSGVIVPDTGKDDNGLWLQSDVIANYEPNYNGEPGEKNIVCVWAEIPPQDEAPQKSKRNNPNSNKHNSTKKQATWTGPECFETMECPPVHSCITEEDPLPKFGRTRTQKVRLTKPVKTDTGKLRAAVKTILVVFLVIMVLIGVDMYRFSCAELGFNFTRYVEYRGESLAQFFQTLADFFSRLYHRLTGQG